ncbi:insulinase family protein [Spiractinospora alimapuensis]|uniref:M16 family metallopeptidase n=1 Tax=Spiractinospora alimapuensis TaxID=2820884 RepID=UPI001F374E8F|nr:pitrilysin family protein [Spiractinospora alimapuensis]QVQ54180.1 insulinase family protein [Spiractinospora alimapuensis]
MSTLQPRPTLGAPQPYTFPDLNRLDVGNGSVIAIDLPGQPYASLRLIHPSGALAEPDGHAGVATLVGETLEDGIEGNSSLAPQLERFGAEWYCRVSWDSFVSGVDAPVNRLEAATALFAEALRSPALTSDDIVRRRGQLVERFAIEVSRPNVMAGRMVGAQLFDGRHATPLGGSPVGLANLEPEDVRAFHRSALGGSAGTLVIVGDLADVDLEGVGKAVFGDAAAGRRLPATTPEPASSDAPRIVVLDRPDSVQSALVLAQRAPSRRDIDLPSAEGMSDVLGGMFTSRLNGELRERRGSTYGVGAGFDLRRDSGVFQIRSQVEGPTTAASLSTTLTEIAWLQAEGVKESELEAVRESNTVGMPVTYSNARALAGAAVEMVVHDLPEDHVDQLRAGFERLTVEDLDRAARELLRPREQVAVVVGDAASIAEPLRDIGFGPVEVHEADTLWS